MIARGGLVVRLAAVSLFAAMMLATAATYWTFFDKAQSAKAAERANALRLCDEHKALEALPILEKLAAHDPDDRVVSEGLARALVAQSDSPKSEIQGRKALLRARALLARFKSAGSLSESGKVLLDMIPPDGRRMTPSDHEDVATAMRDGESAFGRRLFDESFEAYSRAYQLDPKNYEAALYAGDSLFSRGLMNESLEWFARAATIDPNRSAAYRYWGDALQRLAKPSDARERFLEAVVAEPYAREPWLSLKLWAERNHVAVAHPRVLPPAPTDGRRAVFHRDDGTSHVLLHSEARREWRDGKFQAEFPDEPSYRHSLREEVDALGRVLCALAADVRSGATKRLDPSLATLIKIDEEGLLEAFVLISRADAGIAEDYPAYRANHRDQLMRYLSEFVAPRTHPARAGSR
jgi:tetratricopeptide (TPR) repeat protein